MARAGQQPLGFVSHLIAAARKGKLRGGAALGELPSYCLNALSAAAALPSAAAALRLAAITMAGLRPQE